MRGAESSKGDDDEKPVRIGLFTLTVDGLATVAGPSGVVGMRGRSRNTIDAHVGASEAPWEALYETHADDIARYLRRLVGNNDTAVDLMQDTFVHAMRARRSFR